MKMTKSRMRIQDCESGNSSVTLVLTQICPKDIDEKQEVQEQLYV